VLVRAYFELLGSYWPPFRRSAIPGVRVRVRVRVRIRVNPSRPPDWRTGIVGLGVRVAQVKNLGIFYVILPVYPL